MRLAWQRAYWHPSIGKSPGDNYRSQGAPAAPAPLEASGRRSIWIRASLRGKSRLPFGAAQRFRADPFLEGRRDEVDDLLP
ncbi:hypothetical protein NN3_00070 [Nocardia neocaledoniensis NBRC 108232]|nr:hypothetical protein NN3_00070 [Nocardia neocaledoniensis NBRC 108232]